MLKKRYGEPMVVIGFGHQNYSFVLIIQINKKKLLMNVRENILKFRVKKNKFQWTILNNGNLEQPTKKCKNNLK